MHSYSTKILIYMQLKKYVFIKICIIDQKYGKISTT